MRKMVRAFVVALAATGLCPGAVPGAVAQAETPCPSGGTLIKVDVDRTQTYAWTDARRSRSGLAGSDGHDRWWVMVDNSADEDIALRVSPGAVFFGVAGRGRELSEDGIVKAFGKDFVKLKAAISWEMGELRKAGAVTIDESDIQALADAAGLGVLEKDGAWKLSAAECAPFELDMRLEREDGP